MEDEKEVLFRGEKYTLVIFDKLNYALLDTERYEETKRADRALLGYYPRLKDAIMTLTELRTAGKLAGRSKISTTYIDVDTFISQWVSTMLDEAKTITSQIDPNKITG